MRFDLVKKIEEKYNVTFEFVNMTCAGVQDSINNSILAGELDCDVYMAELGWGVPAVMNGLATDLRTVLDPDDPLLTHEDTVLNYVDLVDGSVCLFALTGAADQVAGTVPLAFNLQMIQEANLEDPRDLAAGSARRVDVGQMVDFINVVIDDLLLLEFLNGDYTPAQFQEAYRQTVQDALDQIFMK